MTTSIQQISIPQPCTQSWQQMESRENGRYCSHCAKTVVDFSKMTNEEILSYLQKASNVCGRFDPDRLADINYRLKIKTTPPAPKWKAWTSAACLLFIGMLKRAGAQTKAQAPNILPGRIRRPDATAHHTPAHIRKNKKKLHAAQNSDFKRDTANLVVRRSDVLEFGNNIATSSDRIVAKTDNMVYLEGVLGGVTAGVVIDTPPQVLTFYQYMPGL